MKPNHITQKTVLEEGTKGCLLPTGGKQRWMLHNSNKERSDTTSEMMKCHTGSHQWTKATHGIATNIKSDCAREWIVLRQEERFKRSRQEQNPSLTSNYKTVSELSNFFQNTKQRGPPHLTPHWMQKYSYTPPDTNPETTVSWFSSFIWVWVRISIHI